METIEILGIPVAAGTTIEALAEIERLYEASAPALIAYVNAHTLNLAYKDDAYRRVLEGAGLVLNDGTGVAIAARLNGQRFPANLNGSDFNPAIVELAAQHGWPVFFLGARPGVADRAVELLKARLPILQVAGSRDGFFTDEDEVVAQIKASGAELLMVAMGNPAQEMFLARRLSETGAKLGVGVGAFFDFTAGVVPRAPAWMNKAGIEWLWRLAQEPRRMWRRYVVGNPVFLGRVLKERRRRS